MRDSVFDDKKHILGQFIKNGTAGRFVVNDNGDRKCPRSDEGRSGSQRVREEI